MASAYASQATPLMQTILPATLLLMLNAICIKPLIHLKKTTTISCLSGAGFATNIILNFLLIPKMGVNGSAVATIVAYAFMTVGCLVFSNRHLELKWGLETSTVARVSIVAVLIFLAGIHLPLRTTITTLLCKFALTLVCWLALYLRFDSSNKTGPLGMSFCPSPLQP
jgi:O-antigen/teichoic acid export membrane protein